MKKQEKGIMNSQQAQKASENGTIRRTLRTTFITAIVSLGLSGIAQNSSYNANSITISGTDNSAFGSGSLNNTNTGISNVGLGKNSLNGLTSGDYNSGLGVNALKVITTGNYNTACGYDVLQALGSGELNTGVGMQSLYYLTSASYNTAIGGYALHYNSSGTENCAHGVNSLLNNTTGSQNSAFGFRSLYTNSSGQYNVAVGEAALRLNTSGSENVAVGATALENTAGSANVNTAVGDAALQGNTTGDYNTGLGGGAGDFNTTGDGNTAVGYGSDVSASNLTFAGAFGYGAISNATDKIVIGRNVAGIVIGGYANWSNLSDGRFKSNIKENVPGLTFITKLRPVTYNIDTKKLDEHIMQSMPDEIKKTRMKTNEEYDRSKAKTQTGFIAQEVEKLAVDLGYDFDGVNPPKNKTDNYSLSYSQFVVPLVKAVQEQQTQIEVDSKTIADLQKQINELKEMIKQNVGTLNGATNIQNINVTDKNSVVLDQNVPNPFAESTTISYKTPETYSKAQMVITTIEGKVIKTLDITTKGEGRINIFASDLSSGIYMYSLIVDGKTMETKKLVKE